MNSPSKLFFLYHSPQTLLCYHFVAVPMQGCTCYQNQVAFDLWKYKILNLVSVTEWFLYLVYLVVWYTTSSRKASFLAERRENTLVWRTPHHCIHRLQRKCIFDIFHHLDLSPSTSKQQLIGNARDLRQGGMMCKVSPYPHNFMLAFFYLPDLNFYHQSMQSCHWPVLHPAE